MMKKEKVMYLGPTVPGVVREGTIFDGDIPENVEKFKKKNIHFARLLVRMDKSLQARQQLEEEGSVLAVAFSFVNKMVKEGNIS